MFAIDDSIPATYRRREGVPPDKIDSLWINVIWHVRRFGEDCQAFLHLQRTSLNVSRLSHYLDYLDCNTYSCKGSFFDVATCRLAFSGETEDMTKHDLRSAEMCGRIISTDGKLLVLDSDVVIQFRPHLKYNKEQTSRPGLEDRTQRLMPSSLWAIPLLFRQSTTLWDAQTSLLALVGATLG